MRHDGVGLGDDGSMGLADLPRDIDRDRGADLPRHGAGVLDRALSALPLGLGAATGSGVGNMTAMAIGSISISLSISFGLGLSIPLSVVTSDMSVSGMDATAVADDSGAVANLLGHGGAVLGDHILAVLDVGGLHNSVGDGVADLVSLGVALLIDMSVNMSVAVGLAHRVVTHHMPNMGNTMAIGGHSGGQ